MVIMANQSKKGFRVSKQVNIQNKKYTPRSDDLMQKDITSLLNLFSGAGSNFGNLFFAELKTTKEFKELMQQINEFVRLAGVGIGKVNELLRSLLD
jgi:hypothetical protein